MRDAEPFRDPAYMFQTARQLGLSWRLEYACPHPGRLSESAALLKKKIKSMNAPAPKSDYLKDRRVYQS